ncbi:GNAT family N-acetyltransferase [Roseibium algae]|uniref:GNAT family N-acetyltransferase n=1 Tax=Roseibium algae TaxID=3123038 RepID=A0ABU8TIS0_9HYPH
MQPHNKVIVYPVNTADDLDTIRGMFRAYADWLNIDLSYQGFEAELAGLPGKYAAPQGALLLARQGDGPALGCVAVRPLPSDLAASPSHGKMCEMKRLYVAPEGRGVGLGKHLVGAIIETARALGYDEMRLDTLPTMTSAISLYTAHGFKPIEAYYNTPIAETVFFGLDLKTKTRT